MQIKYCYIYTSRFNLCFYEVFLADTLHWADRPCVLCSSVCSWLFGLIHAKRTKETNVE